MIRTPSRIGIHTMVAILSACDEHVQAKRRFSSDYSRTSINCEPSPLFAISCGFQKGPGCPSRFFSRGSKTDCLS